jgi:NAD(P)-dependent dehydrogenase (short-subunit alcohol dehydrogenase family)
MLTHTVLITGTNHGLGLELVHQMLQKLQKGYKHRPKTIIATCRKPKDATDLETLRKENPDTLVVKELDVTKFEAFPRFVQDIQVKSLSSS